jgi:hypothetical protein
MAIWAALDGFLDEPTGGRMTDGGRRKGTRQEIIRLLGASAVIVRNVTAHAFLVDSG